MATSALSIADEIEHRQWALMAHLDLGQLFLDLLAWQTAFAHFERAHALAETCGSLYFGRIALANLAGTCIAQGPLTEAQALLDPLLDLVSFADPIHRWVWRVRAELALARHQPASSLEITDQLIASAEAAGSAPGATLPALSLLRGGALLELGQLDAAWDAVNQALPTVEQRGLVPLLWRLETNAGLVLRRLGRRAEAASMFAAARATIVRLAAEVPADAVAEVERAPLRAHFLEAALGRLPQPARVTPTRAAKQAAGGLTAREREVALLLSDGISNAAIAAGLVLGRRTVETHVANIYARLGVSSRAQVAAWAVENLRKPPDKTP
jgi:DNA-binding CsgD family transcriptional regulator